MKSVFLPASWTPVVLAWSFLLLLPFGRSFELPIFIMAILGGMLVWRHGKQVVWEGGAKTFSMLFLCIWIPIVLSVPDSLWFNKSLSTALTYPRIYFSGIYLIWVLHEEIARQRLIMLTAWLLLFWVLDALVQAVVGYDFLGYAYSYRLNGLYGLEHLKLGITLAMLSPIVWEFVSYQTAKWKLALAWLGTATVVLLANNRESWIIFSIASTLWGWVYARRLGYHPVRLLIPIALFALVAAIGVYQVNPKFAKRIDKTSLALDLSYEGLNTASSQRVRLWGNSVSAMKDHLINGVGAGAYRYVYARYAEADDPYINADGVGMPYAHQLVLEVGSETGMIGLTGLLVFFVLYIRLGRGLVGSPLAWAAWLGAFAWLFPINTHTAIYSAYWSLLIGWLIAVSSARHGLSDTADCKLSRTTLKV